MSLTGAVVNALAIAGGGAIGLLFRRGIPERVSKTVMIGLGLCVLYIGISGASACRSILIVIVSMTLGAAVGALLNIDGKNSIPDLMDPPPRHLGRGARSPA